MATNLETLDLGSCSSLVELPSSVQCLNKLIELNMSYCDNLEILPTGINLKSLYSLRIRECPRLKSFPDISTNISNLDLGETAIEEFPSYLRLENLTALQMFRMKNRNIWGKVQPLTPLMRMLSPSLTVLWLSDIPSLVELPSSFQDLYKLKKLLITECKNLETLPTDINFQSLNELTLTGCSHLRTFPDISTNISRLCLGKTWIEEVPWWIEDFSRLEYLYMDHCNNLQRISVNICKLKHLKIANFSYCGALTEATMNDSPNAVAMATDDIHFELQEAFYEDYTSHPYSYTPKLKLNFRNSFNFDPEALLHQQSVLMEIVLPGEEVPSCFTHPTSGTSSSSLTNIPMPHTYPSQPFFRIRTCVVVDYGGTIVPYTAFQLCCRFKGRLGNHFDSTYKKECLWIDQKDSHLFIVDCLLPLNKDSDPIADVTYDTVDIKFRLIGGCRLKGWGIRLFEGRQTYQFEECGDSDIASETDQSEEFEEYDYSDTDQSEEFEEYDYSDTDYSEECKDNGYSDTDDSEEYEDNDYSDDTDGKESDVETKRSSKRRRIT